MEKLNGYGMAAFDEPVLLMFPPTGNSPRIDSSQCKGCGLCIAHCPAKMLAAEGPINTQGYRTAHVVAHAEKTCRGCGTCFHLCPEPGAVSLVRIRRTSSSVSPSRTKTA